MSTSGVAASHPLSVMCGCAKCQAAFKAEADARGVGVTDHQTFCDKPPTT